MKRYCFFTILSLSLAFAPANISAAPKTAAKPAAKKAAKPAAGVISKNPYLGAIVIDATTGKVLFENQADAQGYPASMLKLIDLLVILDKVNAGQLPLQDKAPVSAKSAKTGGSQVWLAQGETFTVEDLLYALMIQSANDSAVALAEKVGGSTEGFVALMNQKAAQLGMTRTKFNSVHGLPPAPGDADDVTTARDFSILCRQLLLSHPEALRYTSTRERTFRPGPKQVVMRSHNHLLASLNGCDGLKTGYITKAGYSIAVTASRNGRRVIAVVLDSVDRVTRDRAAADLVNKGFAALEAAGPAPVSVAPAPHPAPAAPARK
jgi:D-alanyl-D-alanine carboxypeptidase (penicillin-binding protein 5/6)